MHFTGQKATLTCDPDVHAIKAEPKTADAVQPGCTNLKLITLLLNDHAEPDQLVIAIRSG